jgi:hypothetical protein
LAVVYVALPHYDCVVPQALPGLLLATNEHRWHLNERGGSLLAMTFNGLLCDALNTREEIGWTHFAMHHADIQAPPGWLDVMVAEMERVRADILSVVVPIKDGRGLTSTALRLPGGQVRRLTMTEIMQLPETFAFEDARDYVGIDCVSAQHGKPLVPDWLCINTGLLLFRFDQPWSEEVTFEVRDTKKKDAKGKWRAASLPEDWNFSGWAHGKGLRVFATRKVHVVHHGKAGFGNDTAWGTCATEPGDE